MFVAADLLLIYHPKAHLVIFVRCVHLNIYIFLTRPFLVCFCGINKQTIDREILQNLCVKLLKKYKNCEEEKKIEYNEEERRG